MSSCCDRSGTNSGYGRMQCSKGQQVQYKYSECAGVANERTTSGGAPCLELVLLFVELHGPDAAEMIGDVLLVHAAGQPLRSKGRCAQSASVALVCKSGNHQGTLRS